MLNQDATQHTVEVLLLSYNGAEFIAEQLKSIVPQLGPTDRIIVSDDGSSDSTSDIVRRIAEKSNCEIFWVNGPGQGVVSNFFSGIRHTTADYVFIADQDDIWLKNKVQLFRKRFHASEKPHLIFSDALVWHPKQNKTTPFWQQQRISPERSVHLPSLLFRNTVQGASMAINRSLINLLVYNNNILIHDWWCALHASAFGKIDWIHTPTLLYRQHSSNQIGANQSRSFKEKRLATVKIFQQAREFCQAVPSGHPFQTLAVDTDHALTGNFQQKVRYLLRYKPIRGNVLRTVTLWSSIIWASTYNQKDVQ